MHYTGPVVRPPHEIGSVMLEVTVGCTHNRCRFCNFYRDTPFRMAPLAQVEEDLREVWAADPRATRVYALGGDPFTMSVERLERLALLIRRYLPQASIGTYARVNSLERKSVEDLRRLHDLGYDGITVGIESGDDEVLASMDKGYAAEDIVRQCSKLEEAGIRWTAIYLGGLAGDGGAARNVANTAAVLNQLHPEHMYMTLVAVMPDTELAQDVAEGRFVESTERERIEETLAMVRALKNPITLFGQTAASALSFNAELPRQREEVVAWLEGLLESFTQDDETAMRGYRASLRSI